MSSAILADFRDSLSIRKPLEFKMFGDFGAMALVLPLTHDV